jgi:acyl-CoA synthetase (AMP-forming)/AMP-acid ligase II
VTFNLADLFESVVDVVADSTAVVAGRRRLTYAELDDRSNRLAHHLARTGIGPGDRVGLQLANGTEYLEGMLACFKIRAVPVNINYRYVATELRYLYADAGLVGLVVHEQFSPAAAEALDGMAEQRAVLRVAQPGTGTGRASLPSPGDDYEQTLAGALGGRGDSRPGRPTTSTASTPGAPRACPRVSCGATRTSSLPPWVEAIRCHSAT